MAALRPSYRVAARLLQQTRLAPPSTTTLPSRRCGSARFYSSEAPPPPSPPLLQKLKGDLKTAMRAKDAARLSAIRSILAATLNASKTANPITTDLQLISLLKKTRRASADASAEFLAAGRQDLVDKEQAQIDVLDEYVAQSGVEEVTEDQLRVVVQGVIAALTSEAQLTAGKARFGDVMKQLMGPGSPLDGKDVEKAQVAKIVKELTDN
ncbi:GatB/YqeY domain-containing protein [Hypoxylon sp. NC1633]|nr:GatB/YqeY domain-containing protein [Hypoxylon sp. NC1633]